MPLKFSDPHLGPETVIINTNGMQLRGEAFESNEAGCSYLRVCDPDGDEIMYWSSDEWAEDPVLVMGAIMGSLSHVEYATEDRYADDSTERCARCGSELIAGKCPDETCPFSTHAQTCQAGWAGHPSSDPRVDTTEKCIRCMKRLESKELLRSRRDGLCAVCKQEPKRGSCSCAVTA
jgi:hypothetical protein